MAKRPPRVPHVPHAPREPGAGASAGAAAARAAEENTLPDAGAGVPLEGAPAAGGGATRPPASGGDDAAVESLETVQIPVIREAAAPAEPSKRGPKQGSGSRRRRADPEDRARRLQERVALEGAIRDQGEDARPEPEAPAPRATAPVPARALSTRVIALALILIISGFMLFPAITTYVGQRQDVQAAQAVIDQEKAEQETLKEQLARWDDPAYVQEQARERISRYLPGEKRWVVVGNPDTSSTEDTTLEPGEYRQGLPWGDGLWDSVLRSSTS